MVAKGLDFREGDNVVITKRGVPRQPLPVGGPAAAGGGTHRGEQQPDGRVYAEDVAEAITDRTRVVAISHVQYASGYRIDLRPIADMVHKAGGYLCVDAIQSLGACRWTWQAMRIDFLSADGHKWLLGPEGCGFFYCKEDHIPMLHPNVVGWMNMNLAAITAVPV